MDAIEFLRIQRELGLKNTDLAVLLGVTSDSIHKWRTGGNIKGPTALAMRLLRKYPEEAKLYA